MPSQRILVVDDDTGVLNIIIAALKADGREFITAVDGVEAVEKIMSESPDIVILDVMLPKMNGYQVCRLMKNDRATWDIPVIMLTARDKDADRLYGKSVGADDYIVKPFHPGDLRSSVNRLLAGREGKPKACPVESPARVSESTLLSRVNSLLDRKLQEMTFLQQMTKAIVSTFDESRILGHVVEGIRTYLGYEHVIVFMVEHGGLLAEKMSVGFPRHDRHYTFDVRSPEILHRVFHVKEAAAFDGEWDGSRFVGDGAPDDNGGARHVLIPIVAREELVGIILIDRSAGGAPFSPERTGVLNTMAGQLGLALENARLYRATLMMSITDGLTGLYNSRYFYERLGIELSRAKRYGRPLTLFMLDIDYFKAFNDNYGHLTGDEALKALSSVIRASIRRDVDTAARYGGEEFCVILPETDGEHSMTLAERLRQRVEETPVDVGDGAPAQGVTVSIGVASVDEGVATPEDLVRRADKALYRAKQEGRNRVSQYSAG